MKHYKVAVFGATVLAAGIAESLKNDAIIIEKTESSAVDYVSCINIPLSEIKKCKKEQSKKFLQEIKNRNLINEQGKVHVFPVAGICAKSFLESNTLLSTDIISVEKLEDEYEITVFNIDGFSKIRAKYIVDTIATGILGVESGKLEYKKYINAAINGEVRENKYLQQGRFENEFVFSLEVKKDTSYSDAVRSLHEKWQKLSGYELKEYEITAVAPQFAYVFENPVEFYIDRNYLFKPSASLKNLGEAYEEGIYVSELFM